MEIISLTSLGDLRFIWNKLDTFTLAACGVIIIAFIVAWIYVAHTKYEDLPKKKKWVDQLPSIISTLGVLGTFLGITRGLMAFDTADLDKSIPILLEGLKTAFFTSLLGMSGSLMLNRIVSTKFDRQPEGSDLERAAHLIIEAMNEKESKLPGMLKTASTQFATAMSEANTIKNIRSDIEQLKDDVEELKGINQELKSAVDSIAQSLGGLSSATSDISEEIPRLRAVVVTATASISAIDNNTEDLSRVVSSIDNNVAEMNETQKSEDML